MHKNGINHRDLYICHFMLDLDSLRKPTITSELYNFWKNYHPKIYLIDLHRAQIRSRVPKRWLIKDLAGLYFSSKDCGLTRNDLLRFLKAYTHKSLRQIFKTQNSFWQKVKKRGDKLYRSHQHAFKTN